MFGLIVGLLAGTAFGAWQHERVKAFALWIKSKVSA
jgi:hypothetical protein